MGGQGGAVDPSNAFVKIADHDPSLADQAVQLHKFFSGLDNGIAADNREGAIRDPRSQCPSTMPLSSCFRVPATQSRKRSRPSVRN